MSSFDKISECPSLWMRGLSSAGDPFHGCLGRIVRSLPSEAYPGWSSSESRAAVLQKLLPILKKLPGMRGAFYAEMPQLSYEQRRCLLERKLISPCMAARQDGCAILISKKQDLSIMINEEEHLVVHIYEEGFDFPKLLKRIATLMERIESQIELAFDPSKGYLTSLPAECGDGIQLFICMSLPALTLSGQMPAIHRAIEKLDLLLLPFYSDQQNDTGNLYVLSMPPAPLLGTENSYHHFNDIIMDLINRELFMRLDLCKNQTILLKDQVGRALGLLTHAARLSFKEFADGLSMLRLGCQNGQITFKRCEDASHVRVSWLQLLTDVAPAHLSCAFPELDQEEIRAKIVQEQLKSMDLQLADF